MDASYDDCRVASKVLVKRESFDRVASWFESVVVGMNTTADLLLLFLLGLSVTVLLTRPTAAFIRAGDGVAVAVRVDSFSR